MKRFVYSLCTAVLGLFFAMSAGAQVNPTGTLTGTVLDAQGAAVVGATVAVTDQATNSATNTQTGADGHFSVPNLNAGLYAVTITMTGFKTGVYRDVKILSGQTYDLSAKIEVGEVVNMVTVEAGQEVVQTADTAINNTVTGATIQQLPFTSRDTLDLAVLDPNTQSDGRPRNSTVSGLPKGAINITFDGINVQDNDLKSSDGFYTYIRPRVDDVEEFTMTTGANSAQDSGEGAVQIGFVSKRGTNDWHGGVWEYNRNTYFDANYYFNNLAGTPRNNEQLNEFGGKVGGPIWKNHIWFYFDMDNYTFPQSLSQQPTILTPLAMSGTYTYAPFTGAPGFNPANPCGITPSTPYITASGGNCNVNLLQMASANGQPATIDPAVHSVLSALAAVPTTPGVSVLPVAPSLYTEQVSFLDKGSNRRHFPDARIDWDVTPRNHLELDEHYSTWFGTPDFLNGAQATFPVAPFNTNQGGQNGFRYLMVAAWRTTLGNSASNEVRVGVQGGPQGFFIGENLSIYPQFSTNLGSTGILPDLFNGLATEPYLQATPQGRNFVTGQANDTLGWTKGTHNMSFGVSTTYIHANGYNDFTELAPTTLAFDNSGPENAMFGNLTTISQSDLANAQQLYATLVGFVNSYGNSVALNPTSRQFQTGAPFLTAERQFEMGYFATDSWRMRPSLTVNYGLRWEYSGAPWDAYNQYFMVQGGEAGLYGASGAGNLFMPGANSGSPTTFINDKGQSWYRRDLRDFAPSLGVAWQPGFENEMLKRMFGEPGRTVVRAAYSIAYTREGFANFESIAQGNPGLFGSQTSSSSAQFPANSVFYNSSAIPGVIQTPTSFTTTVSGITGTDGQSALAIDPNLRTPMVQSYSLGVQRQIGQNMALEVRYQGNHGTRLYRTYNLNEVNILQNGFLAEFNNARNNLAVCKANAAACTAAQAAAGVPAGRQTTNSFANWGLNGQQTLPILTAAFTGSSNAVPGSCASANQCNSLFSNSTFLSDLNNGLTGAFANSLATGSGLSFMQNLVTAGYPSNFFVVNPQFDENIPGVGQQVTNLLDNGGASHYNALVVDFRQRPVHGFLFDFNYSYSHTTDNTDTANYFSLRNPGLNWGDAIFDLRHQFKSQVIYNLPFGAGQRWTTGSGAFNRVIGGWQVSLLTRASSGRPTLVSGGNGGTFNQYDGGVMLNGITVNQIQGMTGVIHTGGAVYWLPASLLDANLQKANSAILQPCNTAGADCLEQMILTGPRFFRADWSLAKHTKITERVELELRVDLLNAFNNPDFLYGGSASTNGSTKLTSNTFGRITSAYQDISTTDDPGGRILQLVGRINF